MRTLALVALLAVAGTAPVLAAPTARVSGGDVPLRSGPGSHYATIGRLAEGSQVTLDYCTRNDRWCLVSNAGWVNAGSLVGWSAKIGVTPPDFEGPGW